jgi:RND family efflux transporter MFP subunit
VVCFALTACKRSGAEPTGEGESGPKTVKCAKVQTAAVKDRIEVRGTVAPPLERDAQVAPQVSGRLLRVEVREGDAVTKGQVVARVDTAPLLDTARQADAAVARARAERQNAETTLARVRRVFEHGIATRQEVDDGEAREASAKAAEAVAVAAAHQTHLQIERASVASPLKGVVLKVIRKPGELVDGTAATPVMEIADTSELELVADVPAQDLVRISKASHATISLPDLPAAKLTGSVARVAPAVDRTTGVGAVRIAIEHSTSVSPPVGTFAVAEVDSGQVRQATLVPQPALVHVTGSEGEVIVCGEDNVAHVRKVRPGPTRGELTEVHGEFAATDLVAVDPVLGLADGDAIEVKP